MLLKNLIGKYSSEVESVLASIGIPLPEASVFFVDSGATNAQDAADGEHGNTWSRPFATLDYAVGMCTASQGDIILLAPGHAEAKTVTGNIALLDIIGVHVIGLKMGTVQPTFKLGHADATLSITAASCKIDGIKVISDIADCATGITIGASADGSVVRNCIFTDGAVAKELVIGISVAADCDNILIEDNIFSTVPSGGCANAIAFAGGCDNSIVRRNTANGTYSAGAFLASVAASVNLTIVDNVFCNQGALALGLHASTTGILARNLLGGTTTIVATLTGEDAIWAFENYITGAAGASGVISPAVDSDT